MDIRSSLSLIFVTLASLTLTSNTLADEKIDLEKTDFELLTKPEQLVGKFLIELQELPTVLKYSVLAAITSAAAALGTYSVHLKKIDMKTKTKKPIKNLTEKFDLQNLSDHAQYLFYKTMSYLAYQNETGEWKGIIPKLDNGILTLSSFFQEARKRVDPLICVAVIYLTVKYGITEERVKMYLKTAK